MSRWRIKDVRANYCSACRRHLQLSSCHGAAVDPFAEYCITSPKGDEVTSVFCVMLEGEPLASDGTITLSDAPGWGLRLNRDAVQLQRFT
jgi:hypothetical protein